MLSLIAFVAMQAIPVNVLIVPGVKIGHVKLGQIVPAILGQATFADGAAGSIWSTWKAADGNTVDTFAQLNAAGSGHAVVYVRVTSASFKTANHVCTGETWGAIKAHYPGVSIKTYHSKQFVRKLSIMDDKAKGISFEVTLNAAQQVTNHSKCLAIWVHSNGVAFNPSEWVIYEPISR